MAFYHICKIFNTMRLIIVLTFIALSLFSACSCSKAQKAIPDMGEPKILTGADRLDAYVHILKGKRVACVVHHASRVGQRHLVDTLLALGIKVTKILAPEHGFRGTADAGEKIDNEKDPRTGLPILSIYGKNKKPSPEQLQDIDLVLFDLQDVGARFYTYISTLHYIIEACGENNLPVVLLDRPNPHAHYIDGPILEKGFESFIGMHQVPVVYGMTIGEYGKMIVGEKWTKVGDKVDLTVVPCGNYKRTTRYDLPLAPSPNLPNATAVLLYPTLCFFEGSQWSVGRGTDKQFQIIGHPGMSAEFSFTPLPNVGAKDPFQKGKKCFGYDYSQMSRDELFHMRKINVSLLVDIYQKTIASNQVFFLENLFFDKLAGNASFRQMLIENKTEKEFRAAWQPGLDNFNKIRSKYLIYE